VSFKTRVVLLALLPLLLLSAVIAWIGMATDLSDSQSRLFEASLLAAKQAELERYLRLAQCAIAPVFDAPGRDPAAAQAKHNRLSYGENGYFFVYDRQGSRFTDLTVLDRAGRLMH